MALASLKQPWLSDLQHMVLRHCSLSSEQKLAWKAGAHGGGDTSRLTCVCPAQAPSKSSEIQVMSMSTCTACRRKRTLQLLRAYAERSGVHAAAAQPTLVLTQTRLRLPPPIRHTTLRELTY
jgi:hypothetical protein